MKKLIIGLFGLVILTFIIIFTVNAQNSDQQSKKLTSEDLQQISQTVSSGSCCSVSGSCNSDSCSTMKCDASKCKQGKCDPATCQGGKCDSLDCKANCKNASSVSKCGPMNCNR